MNGHSIKQKVEAKIFNGYVIEPIPMLAFAVIVGITFLSLAIWATWDILWKPQNTEASEKESYFLSYYRDGPIYTIKTYDYMFDLPVDAIEDEYLLERIIENRTPVVVKYELPSAAKAKSYDVLEITDVDGSVIVTRETISMVRSRNSYNSMMIMWIACLCYCALAIVGNYVLCHAPKYPRLASILVRAPYRNF